MRRTSFGAEEATTSTPVSDPAATGSDPSAPSSASDCRLATTTKPIHSLVLDTGPLIKNEIAISTLLAQAEVLYTIPAIISEIRDEATRSRIHTTLVPFLKLRSPRPDSIKFVSDFARKTGDLQVLSRPDLQLLALTYELECERNGGDWRLRMEPGQKGVNGKPPAKIDVEHGPSADHTVLGQLQGQLQAASKADSRAPETDTADLPGTASEDPTSQKEEIERYGDGSAEAVEVVDAVEPQLRGLTLEEPIGLPQTSQAVADSSAATELVPTSAFTDPEIDPASDSDSDGWITPSNLKKHQARDDRASAWPQPIQRVLQASLLTSDYAMQNVGLRMNLNLVSGSALTRIAHLKTWVLRCHGCFAVTRQTDRQFCPACGQATLTRTACSTSADGSFRLHLKKNYQFNKRGNVYSIPKPVHGSANGKIQAGAGGGRNGWGRELILAEDQKEFTKKTDEERRTKYKDVMDEDYLPNLLSGHRSGGNGRIKVGAGRNVNSKKRR